MVGLYHRLITVLRLRSGAIDRGLGGRLGVQPLSLGFELVNCGLISGKLLGQLRVFLERFGEVGGLLLVVEEEADRGGKEGDENEEFHGRECKPP